jgi:hypothetical protein
LKRKQEGFDGSFHHALCSTLHNLGDSNRRRLGEDECNGDLSSTTSQCPSCRRSTREDHIPVAGLFGQRNGETCRRPTSE